MTGKTAAVAHEAGKPDTASQTVDRAVLLLEAVASARMTGASLSELVALSGLTKPTTRRLLMSLIKNRLVEQDEDSHRYFVGIKAHTLGVFAGERFSALRLASESLASIAASCGDGAVLSVQQGYETVCLAREDGAFPLRSHVLQPSDRRPLGCGAGGMALLAALSDDEVEAALTDNAAVLAANYPAFTPEFLRDQVKETRQQGFAIHKGLIVKGSWAVAIAIKDPRVNANAALTIVGVESRFGASRIPELVALLKAEKAKLQQRMERAGYLRAIEPESRNAAARRAAHPIASRQPA